MRILLGLIVSLYAAMAGAATLGVDTGHGEHRYSTAQLLARGEVRDIDVPGDVSYHRTMRYRAVPLRTLLDGVPKTASVQFVALDGFAATIPASQLLDGHGAEPWLAIEPAPEAWPSLSGGKPGAGPFYLVWLHPEAAHVGPEQWPYQIKSIHVMADAASRFPAMRPAARLSDTDPVVRGFALFQRHCMTCHTLNGQGDAKFGPDLNIPHSPTEYLRDDMLRTLVRDPQALRTWPQAKMPGFGKDVLSDADLDALVAYLKHMATRKSH